MDPVFGIAYGPSGTGKTLAAITAFPTALFIAPKGALKSGSYIGWQPSQITSKGVIEATVTVRKYAEKYPAIILDDFSLICDYEILRLTEQYRNNKNQYAKWDTFNNLVYDLRDVCREVSCHVFWTMHEQAPREVKGSTGTRALPGCPLIPGWQLPEKLPAMADFIARVVYDSSFPGPWPYIYQTGPDEHYVTKDRDSITPPRFPMNLGEILRAAGYEVPRPKDLQWMETAVETIASRLLDLNEVSKFASVLQLAAKKLSTKVTEKKHIRWVLKDSVDRAELRKAQADLISDFVSSYTVDPEAEVEL